jgi:hypothetical protein
MSAQLPRCDYCGQPQEVLGGLVFVIGPPAADCTCETEKRHVCVACLPAVRAQTRTLRKNPYIAGDWVWLRVPVKDAYQETRHEPGDILQVQRIADDSAAHTLPTRV